MSDGYNIIDYVKNNNQSFDEMGFNNVDGLILSQLATYDFSRAGIGISQNGDMREMTIEEIYRSNRFIPKDGNAGSN